MAMPPQDSAPPAADPQGQQPAPPQQEGEGQQDDPKQLLIDVHSGLSKVVALATQAGAPDSVVKELNMSLQSFRSAVEQMLGQGGGGKVKVGVASDMQGGNPNAEPMG